MADQSAIEWCDSTFNPWIGCTKVSPACDHCYAETLMDTRMGRAEWGAGKPRMRTSAANWRKPVQWNAKLFVECTVCGWSGEPISAGGHKHAKDCKGMLKPARRRVFCASLADVFDNEVDDPQWRRDLFDLISATPNLDWLLLTKRIGNVRNLYGGAYLDSARALPRNVWLGATICNQAEADRDIPKLLAVPAAVRFVSIEPMLGPIDLRDGLGLMGCPGDLQWVIAGGESGPHARPSHPDWFRSLRDQCAAAGVPFLFKQWGEWRPPVDGEDFNTAYGMSGKPPAYLVSPDGSVHCFYPHGDTAVRPQDSVHKAMVRVGKKAAGRLLDGREHNGFPVVTP